MHYGIFDTVDSHYKTIRSTYFTCCGHMRQCFFTAHIYVFYTTHSYCLHGPFVVHFLLIPVRCNLRKGGFVVNMGGIELGSSDKHTQNHTYPRIARNPELRGIRGGSLCQLNPAYKKTLFSSYEMGGGMHCAVQTMFRPCSDSIWLGSDSEFRCALATSYTNVFPQRLYRCEKHDALPINSRAKRPILFINMSAHVLINKLITSGFN